MAPDMRFSENRYFTNLYLSIDVSISLGRSEKEQAWISGSIPAHSDAPREKAARTGPVNPFCDSIVALDQNLICKIIDDM